MVKKELMEPSPDSTLIYMPSKNMLGQEPNRKNRPGPYDF